MKSAYLCIGLLSTLPFSAVAQWSAGVAVLVPGSPYEGVGAEVQPIPIIAYEGERLTWRGPSLQYKLSGIERNEAGWQIGIDLAPNELDTDESDALDGIEDRKFSILAGISYSLPVTYGSYQFTAQTDISGKHDGQRLTANFERILFSHPQRKWAVTGGVEVEYLSDNYADYYFGVSTIEANQSTYSVYNVDSIIQPAVTLGGYYLFNQQWRFVASARLQGLASDIENSPIVDRSTSVDGFVGITYAF